MAVCSQSNPDQVWLLEDLAIFTDEGFCLTVCINGGQECIPSVDPFKKGVNVTECIVEPSRPTYQQWRRVTLKEGGENIISVATNTCLASTPDGTIEVDECSGGFYQTWAALPVGPDVLSGSEILLPEWDII